MSDAIVIVDGARDTEYDDDGCHLTEVVVDGENNYESYYGECRPI